MLPKQEKQTKPPTPRIKEILPDSPKRQVHTTPSHQQKGLKGLGERTVKLPKVLRLIHLKESYVSPDLSAFASICLINHWKQWTVRHHWAARCACTGSTLLLHWVTGVHSSSNTRGTCATTCSTHAHQTSTICWVLGLKINQTNV